MTRKTSMEKELSFLILVELHRELDKIFFRHQEALLLREIARAIDELETHQRKLLRHMQDEEDLLLPIYAARTDKIPGGSLDLFTAEHGKMKKFLAEFFETLSTMRAQAAPELPRSIIALFDREFMYKHLAEHHDQRERNVLYPWLDRVTSEAERRALLIRCLGEQGS